MLAGLNAANRPPDGAALLEPREPLSRGHVPYPGRGDLPRGQYLGAGENLLPVRAEYCGPDLIGAGAPLSTIKLLPAAAAVVADGAAGVAVAASPSDSGATAGASPTDGTTGRGSEPGMIDPRKRNE